MRFTVAILCVFTVSCATTPIAVRDYCQIAKPIYLAKGEAVRLSNETSKAILLNNQTWVTLCRK